MVGAASVAPFQGGRGVAGYGEARRGKLWRSGYGMVCRGRVGCGMAV